MDLPPLVCVGASSGGVQALQTFCHGLPRGFPAAVLVVLHISAQASILPKLIDRVSLLPATHAVDGEPVMPGRIYVASPDRHMLVRDNAIALDRGPKEHFTRPAIDPLFRSAAAATSRVAGVVLTGELDDGTRGLGEILRAGGVAVVQSPDEAAAPSMPLSASTNVRIDLCAPLAHIPPFLIAWAAEQVRAAEKNDMS